MPIPIVIKHQTKQALRKGDTYNYVKCDLVCTYKNGAWGASCYSCYSSVKIGAITDCSHWHNIDPFRLFIAIEREKRK